MPEPTPDQLHRGGNVADDLHIRVFHAQSMTIGREWNARDVRSSYWRLYINNRDGAALKLSDGIYPLAARRVHFVPAWARFSCVPGRVIGHFYVHFDVIAWPRVLVEEVFPRPVTLGVERALEAIIDQAARRLTGRDEAPADALCEVKAAVYLALARLLRGLPGERASRLRQAAAGRSPVAAALRHIEDHLARPLPNAELARLCYLSEDHFIRRFRQAVGQTPAQYVLERRVAAAAQKLLFTADKVDAVADQTGFPNRYYFTRVFTQKMGVPPAAYRRTSRV